MQRRVSPPCYPIDPKDLGCPFHEPRALTCTKRKKTDDADLGAIGAANEEYMDTKQRTVTPPTHDVHGWKEVDAWSPITTMGTTRTSSRKRPAPIEAITTESYSLDYMPRRKRLKSGNGPDTDGQDSPMRWMEHWSDGNGAAGSALAVETDQCEGGGTGYEQTNDSRLNFRSWYGPRPSTGGDDTFLTPYSTSTMTDSAVESLPTLFLAYCALDSADQAWPMV